jgi:uncharacterized protein YbcI
MAANGMHDPTIPATPPEAAFAHGPGELTQITRALVTIYKDHFGRGPNHAHSHYAGADTIICILEGTLTPVENSLVVMGEQQSLQNLRQLFQAASEEAFCSAVEAITGRKVASFMSGNDIKHDVSSEIFVFERDASGAAPMSA